MGVQKKTRKFAVAKRTIQLRDSRLLVPRYPRLSFADLKDSSYSPRFRKANDKTDKNDKAGKSGKDEVVREA